LKIVPRKIFDSCMINITLEVIDVIYVFFSNNFVIIILFLMSFSIRMIID